MFNVRQFGGQNIELFLLFGCKMFLQSVTCQFQIGLIPCFADPFQHRFFEILNRFRQGVPFLSSLKVEFCSLGELLSRGDRFFLEEICVFKKGSQPIEIMLADRIEFMRMALRAAELQSQSDRTDGRGDVVQKIVVAFLLQVDIGHVGSAQKKPGGNGRGGISRPDFIPGQL